MTRRFSEKFDQIKELKSPDVKNASSAKTNLKQFAALSQAVKNGSPAKNIEEDHDINFDDISAQAVNYVDTPSDESESEYNMNDDSMSKRSMTSTKSLYKSKRHEQKALHNRLARKLNAIVEQQK